MARRAVSRPAGRGRSPSGAPLRVLVVDHTAELGGAELALVRLCQELVTTAADLEVRALLLSDGPLAVRLEAVGVPVETMAAERDVVTTPRDGLARGGLVRRARGVLRTQVALRRALRRSDADVVHTTSLKAHLLASLPALVTGRRLVWYAHDRVAPDYLPRPVVLLVRAVGRLPHVVIANSRATAATLGRAAVVAHPGLDPAQGLDPGRPVPARSGPPVVGLVGRVSPTKGQLELVRAAPRVLAHRPEVRFRVVGGPTFGAEEHLALVQREAARLGVAGHLEWAGTVPDTRAELDAMAVCVHASPVPEPFGQVVVEALARGVPVVATDAGGVPEILGRGPGALGALVPPGDVTALADAILAVLDDLPAATHRADRARAEVAARFGVAGTARVVSGAWRVAARPGRRRRP